MSNHRAPVLNPDEIGAGRHVYRNIEYQQPQAPVALNPDEIGAGRHVTTTLYKIRDNKITPATYQYEV